ncbi:MAG: hypothetical protein AB7O91_00570 [Sphingomonas sp.]
MTAAFKAILALCLAAAATPGIAQDVAGLDWLAGRWQGAGTAFGRASEASLEVHPVLGGRFLEFSYRAGPFEGRAFYRPHAGQNWRATWFDNRGMTFPIEAMLDGRTLTANWHEDQPGRTTYVLADDGNLTVTDAVPRPEGGWRTFAVHVMRRAD